MISIMSLLLLLLVLVLLLCLLLLLLWLLVHWLSSLAVDRPSEMGRIRFPEPDFLAGLIIIVVIMIIIVIIVIYLIRVIHILTSIILILVLLLLLLLLLLLIIIIIIIIVLMIIPCWSPHWRPKPTHVYKTCSNPNDSKSCFETSGEPWVRISDCPV